MPATARYPTPVFSGEKCSTCCMYSVSIRNMANMPVPRKRPTTFAAAKVCSRKIEKGTKGSFTRFSQTRNATSSTETTNTPIVSAELQPHARP